MQSFRWDKQFETGLDEVDEQHRRLVDLINDFASLLSESKVFALEQAEKIFTDLTHYAEFHFKEEEALMERVCLDARFVSYHKALHANFVSEIARFYRGIAPDNKESLQRLLRYLINWLAYHILGTDKVMAKQVSAINAGQSVEQAYLSVVEHLTENSIDPFLNALNGLFQEVCERNRELTELNLSLEARVAERTLELMNANKYLEEIALTDMLTGLPNRRHALIRLAKLWNDSNEAQSQLACLLLDADGFKQVNDTHGHDAGDEVLRQLARELKDSVRTDDLVSRLGGDEFLVILPNTHLQGAKLVAENMRKNVSEMRVPVGTGQWVGSISVGVAIRQSTMKNHEAIIKAADDGLYLAKSRGRNCVCVAVA
jgi:diguanylate cyclase (GGDEF)-like protein/hemerythrin-like metal-binding protein